MPFHRRAALVGLLGFLAAARGRVARAAKMPADALRKTPPEGIAKRVPAVGDPSPGLELPGTRGTFSLAGTLKSRSVLVLFFRGAW